MIITQTPFRMSFFGGGTDLPAFFNEHGGAVLSTSFDKYCYVNVRHLPRFFDYTSEISYSRLERVTDVNDIRHPAVREAMKYLDMREIRLTYEADLPARSGLGTSSSFAVGMLNAFYALKGKYADKKKLADDAIYLERVLCNEAGGLQDQIAASFGGFNRINFHADGYTVNPVILSPQRKQALNSRLMLFFTGFSRFSFSFRLCFTSGFPAFRIITFFRGVHHYIRLFEHIFHRFFPVCGITISYGTVVFCFAYFIFNALYKFRHVFL